MGRHVRNTGMMAGVCLGLLPVGALAQTAADADEIIVTATKTNQPIEDIAGSVRVLDGALAETANRLAGAEEMTKLMSGVQAAVANGTQVAFQIRGIGAVDHQALTPTAAAVYVDGVFLATNVQTGFLPYDLERIEILKGPQGSLYGRNASSGAINFITARPGAGSYGEISYGSHERIALSGALDAPVSEDLSLRLAGRRLTQDAVLDNVRTDPAIAAPEDGGGKRDEWGLRGALLWTPGETELLARAHWEEDNGINVAPRNDSLAVGDHELSIGPDGIQPTDNEFYGVSAEVSTTLGVWEMFSLSAFEGYDQEYGFDFDGAPAPFGDTTLNANLSYNRDFRQYSQELRANRETAWGSTLVGLALSTDDFSQDYLIWCGDLDEATLIGSCPYVGAPGRVGPTPASDGTPMSLLTHIEQERDTAALFTWNDIALSKRLSATIGARYTAETIEGAGFGLHVFDDGTVALNDRDGLGPARGANEIDEGRLSGNLAVSYQWTDRDRVYASYANGYKSGGFNGEVQNNATHFADEGLFGVETVNAYEIGYKAVRSPRLSYSLAAFWQDYDSPQARIFVDFPQPDGSIITSNSLSNLDAATSYGVEGTLAWMPLEGLDVDASVTLLETEIDQESDDAGNAALFDGNPLPFASPVSASLSARYERPVGAETRIALTGILSHKAEYYLDAEGLETRREDGYTTLDLEASLYLDDCPVELSVWGRNLTDEDYAVSGYGFIGYNTFRSAPRQYGVSLRKTF